MDTWIDAAGVRTSTPRVWSSALLIGTRLRDSAEHGPWQSRRRPSKGVRTPAQTAEWQVPEIVRPGGSGLLPFLALEIVLTFPFRLMAEKYSLYIDL